MTPGINPPRLLTKAEYLATVVAPMTNVTATATEVADLWSYVDSVAKKSYQAHAGWNWQVDHIYETADGACQHVGLPAPKDNTFLIVLVDRPNQRILGHYILDLAAVRR